MEQAKYWMWRHGLNSQQQHLQASRPTTTTPSSSAYYDSWEEQAFAEDADAALGGCIWPPRSYSCTFCGREFRSAQALGGHMNVHRRDRARLKQSPTSPDENLHHHDHQNNQNQTQNPFLPIDFRYQHDDDDQVCKFVYNLNPNSSTSIVSHQPTKENCPESLVPPFSSPKSKKSPNSIPSEGEKRPNILESECKVKADYVQTDLSVSLNLVVLRTLPPTTSDNKEEAVGCKRKRNDTSPTTLPFLIKPVSTERHDLRHAEVPELSSSLLVDDIDLELRLGGRPTDSKVK